MSPSRRFVQIHLLTLMALLAAVGILNLVADPFDYFRPALSGTLDPYKKRSATRYARGNAVAAGDWDVIFCGASRTEIGFDPGHPSFEGKSVYNFGLTAAKYPEIWWSSKFALESNPHVQTLWIELDPSYLIHNPLSADFLNSCYGPRTEPVNYGLGQLLGSLATERSVSALSRWRRDEPSVDYFTPLGLRVRPMRPPNAIAWDWFAAEMLQRRSKRDAQVAAHRAERNDPNAPWLDLSFLDNFHELLDIAAGQQAQVVVIVPPSHVVRLAQFIDEGWHPQVNEFKRELASLAGDAPRLADGRSSLVVYDFLVDDDANAEPLPRVVGEDTRWHWEAGHFRVELGNRMLGQIAVGDEAPPGTFGARLTPETINEHLLTADAALAQRLPTIALLREQFDCQQLVQQLQPDRTHIIATRRKADDRIR